MIRTITILATYFISIGLAIFVILWVVDHPHYLLLSLALYILGIAAFVVPFIMYKVQMFTLVVQKLHIEASSQQIFRGVMVVSLIVMRTETQRMLIGSLLAGHLLAEIVYEMVVRRQFPFSKS